MREYISMYVICLPRERRRPTPRYHTNIALIVDRISNDILIALIFFYEALLCFGQVLYQYPIVVFYFSTEYIIKTKCNTHRFFLITGNVRRTFFCILIKTVRSY